MLGVANRISYWLTLLWSLSRLLTLMRSTCLTCFLVLTFLPPGKNFLRGGHQVLDFLDLAGKRHV